MAAIAALANLELDPSEIELFARQLGDILAYADEVQQIDTTGVPPTTSVVTDTRPIEPTRCGLRSTGGGARQRPGSGARCRLLQGAAGDRMIPG